MEIEKGLEVVVLAGTWLNKKTRGKYSTALSGTVVRATDRTVMVKPDAKKFNRKPLHEREFWLNEVFVRSDWDKGNHVNLNDYIKLPKPKPPTGPGDECKCCKELELRLEALEKKVTMITNSIHDKYSVNSSIKPNDL